VSTIAPIEVIRHLGREKEVERLEARIEAWLDSADPAIRAMLNQQFHGLSKFFRPLTVFGCHFSQTREPVPDRMIVTAQAVEMIHNVTLIIDDIVDHSDERRGKPTLHPVYDSLTAYMVSGFIVADAYDLLARTMSDEFTDLAGLDAETQRRRREAVADRAHGIVEAVDRDGRSQLDQGGLVSAAVRQSLNNTGPVRFDMRLISELMKRLAVAECVQWDSRKGGALRPRERRPRVLFGLADWHYLAREDTGCMFEICAVLGARSQRFRRFGRLLGMLYHGCDDVADVKQSVRLGGGGDEDVRDGILTLPAALALQHDPSLIDIFSKDPLDEDDTRTLTAAFQAQLGRADEELDRIQAQAIDEAESLGVPYVDELLRLVEQVRPLSI
jgi:geranylgeranyl pyrophosphate synthase